MLNRVDMSLAPDGEAGTGDILCRIEVLDRELHGHDAVLSLIAEVEVKDPRPVNGRTTLHEAKLRLGSIPAEIRIPREAVRAYTYSGRMIRAKLSTRLVVDDSILFDTKITEEQELRIGTKPSVSTHAKSIIEPSDAFDFFKNLKAIPVDAQMITLVLAAVGGIVVLINTIVGLHDQFSPEVGTWVYSHFDSDGDSSPPLVKSLAGSGGIGALVWLLMRGQLRRYMEFGMRRLPHLRRDRTYSVRDLVRGRSRVPLHDVALRVVACNMERGQYRRGSGTDERTVSFREPVRGIVLYEKTVDHIPPGVPISPHFDGAVDFAPMFATLYPPFSVTASHGVEVHWEVQLLHPEYVDQELAGPKDRFRYEDFLEG